MRLHLILGKLGRSEPGQGGLQPEADVVEHETPFDARFDLAAAFLEFPREDPADQAQPIFSRQGDRHGDAR